MDLHLVQEPRAEVLLRDVCPPGERHIFLACGLPCLLERRLYALRHERELGPTLQLERLPGVMGEDEHRVMERRVVTPPAVPWVVPIPRTGVPAEHVPSHDRGADPRLLLLDDLRAFVDLTARKSMRPTPCGDRDDPLVETIAADPERVLHALVESGNEAVEGHRDPEAQPRHDLAGLC